MKRTIFTLSVVLLLAMQASAQCTMQRSDGAQTQGCAWQQTSAQTQGCAWQQTSAQEHGCAWQQTSAQKQGCAGRQSDLQKKGCGCDSVLLSQIRNGNTVVSRYLIKNKRSGTAEFTICYAINLSNISQKFSDNSMQIADIKTFADKVATDTLMHIVSVAVDGYASPDGNAKSNAVLATHRAEALQKWLVSVCPHAPNAGVDSKAYTWKDCTNVVQNSAIPNRGEVLGILNSSFSEAEKEARLKRLPESWNYLKKEILPAMRCATATIRYKADAVVEHTTTVTPPQPAKPAEPKPAESAAQPQPQQESLPVMVIEEEETGIIIEMPHEREHSRHRRDHK